MRSTHIQALPKKPQNQHTTTSTLTALAVTSFNKTTDRKFNAVGGKKKKTKQNCDAAQVGE